MQRNQYRQEFSLSIAPLKKTVFLRPTPESFTFPNKGIHTKLLSHTEQYD